MPGRKFKQKSAWAQKLVEGERVEVGAIATETDLSGSEEHERKWSELARMSEGSRSQGW